MEEGSLLLFSDMLGGVAPKIKDRDRSATVEEDWGRIMQFTLNRKNMYDR